MPTARPSITPSTGVTDTNSTIPENDSDASEATPTPSRAVTRGRAAPSTVPSMTNRTMAAMTTPAISPGPRIEGTVWAISCDGWISTPEMPASATMSSISVLVSMVTSLIGSSKTTLATAADPSSDTVR